MTTLQFHPHPADLKLVFLNLIPVKKRFSKMFIFSQVDPKFDALLQGTSLQPYIACPTQYQFIFSLQNLFHVAYIKVSCIDISMYPEIVLISFFVSHTLCHLLILASLNIGKSEGYVCRHPFT